MKTFTLATQNMTEGRTTAELRRAGVVLGQEISAHHFTHGLPDHETFLSRRRAPGLGVAWRPDVVQNARTGSVQFHQSGEAEEWDFRTPARGMAWVRGDVFGVPCVFFTVWLLNSWAPIRPDKFTAARRAVVETSCLPVIRRYVRDWQREGLYVAGGGDGNSIRAALDLPGLDQPAGAARGLDRLWVDRLGGFYPTGVRELPVTGAGTDMRHHGLSVCLRKC